MKIIATALAALAAATLLTACEKAPESGYITSRTFNRQHQEKNPDTSMCTAYSDTGMCKQTIWIPGSWYTVPDRWYLTIKSEDGKHKGDLEVTHETYERYTVGSHYPDPR